MRTFGLILFLTAGAAYAGEFAVLASGSRLHVDRHETDGAKVRLYLDTGFVEMDAATVRAYENDERVAALPAAALSAAALSAAALSPVTLVAPALPAAAVVSPALSAWELADRAADKYGLPRHLVRSVMAAESGFQPLALSPKGAIGLMQLMPGTAAELGVDPYDPAQNVDAGTRYLRDLLSKYDGGLRRALAAYNSGPATVDRYNGVPPYRETVNYVFRIENAFKKASGVTP
jgi:soluble lytic murein transglycosylase-like protein